MCVHETEACIFLYYERNKETHTLAHRLFYSNDMIQENDPKKSEREKEEKIKENSF